MALGVAAETNRAYSDCHDSVTDVTAEIDPVSFDQRIALLRATTYLMPDGPRCLADVAAPTIDGGVIVTRLQLAKG